MSATTRVKPKSYTSDVGTIFNVSVPYHEQHLIEVMDELQHLERCNSRSQLIRKWIRREREANKEQLELLRTYRG